MAEAEEITEAVNKLKQVAITAPWWDEREKAINLLAQFEAASVSALADVAQQGKHSDERLLAMKKLEEIIARAKAKQKELPPP